MESDSKYRLYYAELRDEELFLKTRRCARDSRWQLRTSIAVLRPDCLNLLEESARLLSNLRAREPVKNSDETGIDKK